MGYDRGPLLISHTLLQKVWGTNKKDYLKLEALGYDKSATNGG